MAVSWFLEEVIKKKKHEFRRYALVVALLLATLTAIHQSYPDSTSVWFSRLSLSPESSSSALRVRDFRAEEDGMQRESPVVPFLPDKPIVQQEYPSPSPSPSPSPTPSPSPSPSPSSSSPSTVLEKESPAPAPSSSAWPPQASPSPTPAIDEAIAIVQELNISMEETITKTNLGDTLSPNTMLAPSSHGDSPDSPAVLPQQQQQQQEALLPEWRIKLEEQLRAAKAAIETAPPLTEFDPELSSSTIYNNISRFKKSYELMEEIFKVYTYSEGKPPLVHTGPLTGIYSSEGRFIHELDKDKGKFVTSDPQKAHMFFLPYSVAHMVIQLYVPGSRSMLPLATFIKDYVNQLAARYPFWNMTRGSDHFFVSCHDWGPATARDHKELRRNTVKVVCNADMTEEYLPDKDASLPEIYLHSLKLPTKFGGPGPAKRPILAFFAGQMHGRVRPVLLQHWKDKGDPDMRIYEVLPRDVERKMGYVQHMKSSKFCICAMGFEVNSPRIVESIYYECVPVILADNFVLPFSDVINWGKISVTVPERDIPRLKEILMGISASRYRNMQSRLKKVRKHFMWHDVGNAQRYDMFHMILHSVWTRRLMQIDNITRHEITRQ